MLALLKTALSQTYKDQTGWCGASTDLNRQSPINIQDLKGYSFVHSVPVTTRSGST